MKQLILGLAIAGLTFACQSEPKTSVGEACPMSGTECTSGGDCCEEGMKGACSDEMKAECATKKEECSGEVCPVTGKPKS